MKCKQCGWDNPDSYERCEKCGNLLARQRPFEAPMMGYDNQPIANGSYSNGYEAGPNNVNSLYGNQPYNNDITTSQQPSSPLYRQPDNVYPPQTYYPAEPAQPQPTPQVHGECYCPECDAELPVGATECPVCHAVIRQEIIEVVDGVCPDCGTEVTPVQNFCHCCGARLKEPVDTPVQPIAADPDCQPVEPEFKESDEVVSVEVDVSVVTDEPESCSLPDDDGEDTIPSGPLAEEIPECRLQMLAPDGSELLDHTVVCAGDEVDLYRSNTDPANNTIARDLQARLSFADGKWSIEDCSSLRTTYVRPGRKLELRDGDVIVMGNREFIFKL